MLPTQESVLKSPQETSLSTSLIGLGTAVPRLMVTQEEALEFILNNFEIKPATRVLYQRTLRNKAIRTRHFALDQLTDVLDKNHERVNARFEREAVRLSSESLTKALGAANLAPQDIDYLVVATCTGYLCPGLAPQLIEKLQMKRDVHYADLVGMGCAAAIPAIEQACNFTRAHPGAIAAVVSTEICSAAMFSNDDIDIVVSNSIFSDGSAAVILSSESEKYSFPPREGRGQGWGETPGPLAPLLASPLAGGGTHPSGWRTSGNGSVPRVVAFGSLVIPEWRDTLRFRTEGGHLKNVLGKDVPVQAGQAIKKLAQRLLSENGLESANISHWMLHPGGEKVIREAEKALELNSEQTKASWEILRDHGNMSSSSVLFVLEKEMKIHPPRPGEWGFLCSFGAGFSVHAALLEF